MPAASLFFILIIILGNFLIVNLYIGVIITSYNRQRELMGKDFMLTEKQSKWVISKMMILSANPKFSMKMPHNEWR
jgi:hypothetical protein